MFWTNTKLLFRLYYRPVAAMSGIIDEGHWLYAVISVVGVSLLLQAAITAQIHYTYEAVTKEVPAPAVKPVGHPATVTNTTSTHFDDDEEEEEVVTGPRYVTEQLPLPVVGKYGWWFVSFAPGNFFSSAIGLAVLYVPCLILLIVLYGSAGSFSVVLRRDYGPLLNCALMAWTAGHLPFVILGFALVSVGLGARTALVLWILSAMCFGLLMAFGVRTLFGIDFKKSIPIVCFAALAFSLQAKLFSVVSPFMFSPFILFYAYSMFRGDIGDIGFSLRQRQSFRRSMEAATINPRDASAHYQLGLVFQHRRQYAEAISRFERAIEIAHDETDAHFQLGRIAREQNRLQDAINHFSVVLSQDDKHAHSEIWREIGATYLAAQMFQEASDALETFVERRAYDPEGLYYYGRTLSHLGKQQEAHEMFARCIEAVKTMPQYRHGDHRKWNKLAREQLTGRADTAKI